MDRVLEELVPEGETLNADHVRNLFFGNYIEPDADPKIYDEVTTTIISNCFVENVCFVPDIGFGRPNRQNGLLLARLQHDIALAHELSHVQVRHRARESSGQSASARQWTHVASGHRWFWSA